MNKFLILFVGISFLFFFGCSEDEKDVNEFEVLTDYLENSDANYQGWANTLSGWVVDYSSVSSNLNDYLIVDLRSATDYTANHINGAVNTTLSGLLDTVDGETGKILCVCYTGQTAAYAHMLLRLEGYEAYSLKWGMSGVDASLDRWTGNCSNQYYGTANWVTSASPTLPEFDFPTLDTGNDDAKAILDARVQAALDAWSSRTIKASTIMEDPAAYHLLLVCNRLHRDGTY